MVKRPLEFHSVNIRPYDLERWGKMCKNDVLALSIFNAQAFKHYVLGPYLRENYEYLETAKMFTLDRGSVKIGPGAIVPMHVNERVYRIKRKVNAERTFQNGEKTGDAAAISLRPVRRSTSQARGRREAAFHHYRYTTIRIPDGQYTGSYHVPYGWALLVTRYKNISASIPWTYEPINPHLGWVDEDGDKMRVTRKEAMTSEGMAKFQHLPDAFFQEVADKFNLEERIGRTPEYIDIRMSGDERGIYEVPRGSYQAWHPGNIELKPIHPVFGFELDSDNYMNYLSDYARHYPNDYRLDEVALGVDAFAYKMIRDRAERQSKG